MGVHSAPEIADALAESGILRRDGSACSASWEIIQRTRESVVQRIRLKQDGLPPSLIVKTYKYRFPRILRTFLIPARAHREYENIRFLHQRDYPTPRPIACGVKRILGFVRETTLVLEELPDAIDLKSLVRARKLTNGLPDFPLERRRPIIEGLAKMLRELHAESFHFHTLFDKNILITDPDGDAGFAIIDLPFARILIQKLRPTRARIRDLATLNKFARRYLTRTDTVRFLHEYLGVKRLDPKHRKQIAAVNRYTDKLEDKTLLARFVRLLKGRGRPSETSQ